VLVRGSVGEADAARDDRVACYRCAFPTPPAPGTVPSCAEAGVFGPLPAVVGSLMASEALKLLLGWEGVLAGRLLLVDLAAAATQSVALERDPACPACGDAPTVPGPIDYAALCGVTRDWRRRPRRARAAASRARAGPRPVPGPWRRRGSRPWRRLPHPADFASSPWLVLAEH